MPVIKSAKKKLRQDIKREKENKKLVNRLSTLIKKARKQSSEVTVREAISLADKALKKHLFHANKVARIKSQLTKLLSKKPTPKSAEKITKTSSSKTSKK